MKQLLLVRHGKSSWDLDVRDHDRVLLKRGIDDAHLIGKELYNQHIVPDVIWTSTAARALQTATLITEYIDYDLSKLRLNRSLYTFDSNQIIDTIINCDDSFDSLMIISHNMGLTETANRLGSSYFDMIPTTGVIMINFDTDHWSQIDNGDTITHIFPRALK